MESIKNAIGLGSGEQQGREPVNGTTGAGTAGEPFDQGNAAGEYFILTGRDLVGYRLLLTNAYVAL